MYRHLCHPLNINNKGSDFLPNHRISYIFFGGGNSHHMYLLEEELLFLTKKWKTVFETISHKKNSVVAPKRLWVVSYFTHLSSGETPIIFRRFSQATLKLGQKSIQAFYHITTDNEYFTEMLLSEMLLLHGTY